MLLQLLSELPQELFSKQAHSCLGTAIGTQLGIGDPLGIGTPLGVGSPLGVVGEQTK